MNDSNIFRLIDTFISSLISVYSEYTILSVQDTRFKVRGPFVQTLCIEKDSYMDAI